MYRAHMTVGRKFVLVQISQPFENEKGEKLNIFYNTTLLGNCSVIGRLCVCHLYHSIIAFCGWFEISLQAPGVIFLFHYGMNWIQLNCRIGLKSLEWGGDYLWWICIIIFIPFPFCTCHLCRPAVYIFTSNRKRKSTTIGPISLPH